MATTKFSDVDEYGFKRPSDFDYEGYEKFMEEYLPVLTRRRQRWDQMMGGGKDIKPGIKVKRFVRKGIPSNYRSRVWMSVSGADAMRRQEPDLYLAMLAVKTDPTSPTVEQISTDIPRTFPNNVYFGKDCPKGMQQSLFNVLLAFSNVNPKVGYCQGLNYVAGMLLLVTKDEDKAFWLLRALTEKILPEYYGPEIPGLLTDIRVFAELIRKKVPTVYRHVESFRMPWALVCSKWFVCLYSDVLPVETILRIWDCMFYEGSKILLRVAITLVMLHEDKLMATHDFAELVSQFQKCTVNELTLQCHDFVTLMFEKSSPLPSKTLDRLRTEIGYVVREEHIARDKLRKERDAQK